MMKTVGHGKGNVAKLNEKELSCLSQQIKMLRLCVLFKAHRKR